MSHICPQLAPGRGHRAIGKFNQVERIVHVFVELDREQAVSLELNWQAMPQFKIGNGLAPMSSASWKYS